MELKATEATEEKDKESEQQAYTGKNSKTEKSKRRVK